MTEPQFAQVAYMPYAPIVDSFRIGSYEIWPYYKESGTRIKNEDVIQHLNRHFGRYFERAYDREKGGYDKALEEIFIISTTNFQLGISKFSDEQIEEIRTLCHIIAFCAINEPGFEGFASDEFIVRIQNFQVGSDGIAFPGKYFMKLEMVKFMKPYSLPSHLLSFSKTPLCDALGEAFQFKTKANIRRIFRALELFYHTATHDEMVSNQQRLLSLVMCFEVMLNFKGKMKFAKEIEKELNNPKREMETRIVKIKDKDTNVRFSKTGWWAFDLYNLRSAIVHGNEINWDIQKYGDVWTRIEFGGTLLTELIKQELRKESLWQSDSAYSIREFYSLDDVLENIMNRFTERCNI